MQYLPLDETVFWTSSVLSCPELPRKSKLGRLIGPLVLLIYKFFNIYIIYNKRTENNDIRPAADFTRYDYHIWYGNMQ